MQTRHCFELIQNAAPILSRGPDVPLRHYRHQLIPRCHLIRLMPVPAEPRRGANYVRQQTDTWEHFR
jgi:hypothetical protein